MSLEDCRSRLPIWSLFGKLGLAGADKVGAWGGGGGEVKICSPLREDRTPSFSVFVRDGVGFWKDHGTDESGDEVKLIEAARGLDNREAIKLYHELAGVPWGADKGGGTRSKKTAGPKLAREPEKPKGPSPAEKALGIEPGAKPPEKEKKKDKAGSSGGALGEVVKTYQYVDEQGEVLHETLRFEPKAFRQRRPAVPGDDPATVRDGWVWSLKGGRVVPYRLPELLGFSRAEPVFLVEGEKDVENLERLEKICATTLPMGAGKWREEFASYFRDRWVVIVVDDDFAGRKGAAKVADELMGIAERVGLVTMEDLWPEGEDGADVSDWLEWGWEIGITIEEQQEKLWEAAERSELVKDDPYEDVIVKVSRGVTVAEDRLAREMVKREKLIFVGDKFWKYAPDLGKWEPLSEKTWVDRKVRRILAGQPGTDALINNSRVKSIVSLAKTERVLSPEELNQHPTGMLACRNGLVEVESGRLFPHRERYFTTVQIPHFFDPGATCPEWLGWLAERQEDQETRDQIQEMFGYCLMNDINFHSFFFLYGDGGTGKSTCVDVLEWLVGAENRVSIELTELDNPFLRSRLVGKSLYLAKELTSKSFKHIGLIKAMVSGDPISVDVKYADGFEFRPSGRLVMESNVQAMTPDSSAGFERRFIQISFDKKIDRSTIDFSFGERFQAEMSGILNWAIEGYRRLRERGRFQHTAKSQKASDDIKMHRAQVESFLKDGSVKDLDEAEADPEFGDGNQAWISLVYEGYLDWCDDNAVVPWFKDALTFKRELFVHRPEWKGRQKRARKDGERDYMIEGVVMKVPEVEPEEL